MSLKLGGLNCMDSRHPKSTASIAGHPIHVMLVLFPIDFFILAPIMNVAYRQTSNLTPDILAFDNCVGD